MSAPAPDELAIVARPRKQKLGHPWTRGYRNNKRLRELAGEPPPKRYRKRIIELKKNLNQKPK